MKSGDAMAWFWLFVYWHALYGADNEWPVLYSSRIDGALLPFAGYADAYDTV